MTDLYFTCYTWNAVQMGQILARDLKMAQYVHLSPRCTYTIQVMGCVVGALFNYIMMLTYALSFTTTPIPIPQLQLTQQPQHRREPSPNPRLH